MGNAAERRNISARGAFITAVMIYGTIGWFLRQTDVPSSATAFYRAAIGTGMLFGVLALRGRRIPWSTVRRLGTPLLISGACLGLNWVFLFASWRASTVAVGSLCNYTAPILILILLSIRHHRPLSPQALLCVASAAAGIVLVSGVVENAEGASWAGIAWGLASALGFVGVVLCNRRLTALEAVEKTALQLLIAALVVLPYTIIENGRLILPREPKSIAAILTLGAVHTGLAYILYFGSMTRLPVESFAILGYLEPVISVLISVFILREPMTGTGMAGAALILGAAICNEWGQIQAEKAAGSIRLRNDQSQEAETRL